MSSSTIQAQNYFCADIIKQIHFLWRLSLLRNRSYHFLSSFSKWNTIYSDSLFHHLTKNYKKYEINPSVGSLFSMVTKIHLYRSEKKCISSPFFSMLLFRNNFKFKCLSLILKCLRWNVWNFVPELQSK